MEDQQLQELINDTPLTLGKAASGLSGIEMGNTGIPKMATSAASCAEPHIDSRIITRLSSIKSRG